jgi:hypothetical protein
MNIMVLILLSSLLVFITLIKVLDELKGIKEDLHSIRRKVDRLDKLQKQDFDNVLDAINMVSKKVIKFNDNNDGTFS